jgi:hypothetical protein
VEMVVAWFLFAASVQERWWGGGTARTFMILCFCDGEDYRRLRKKSLNKSGNTLNTVCQMPLRHSLYDLAYDVAPFDGYSSVVSSDILLPF